MRSRFFYFSSLAFQGWVSIRLIDSRPVPSTTAVAFLDASIVLGLVTIVQLARQEVCPQALRQTGNAARERDAGLDLWAIEDKGFLYIFLSRLKSASDN